MDTEAGTTYLLKTMEAQQEHTTVSSPADC